MIGLTSDELARVKKGVKGYEARQKNLESYLHSLGHKNFEIHPLSDPFGRSVKDADLDLILVTEETQTRLEELNRIRRERGLAPLKAVVLPLLLAEDSLPISSSRIRSGDLDEEGRLRRPLQIRVGSENLAKVRAVETVFGRFFLKAEVKATVGIRKVNHQPLEEQVVQGAKQRAQEAIREADYGVGIEAGLIKAPGGSSHLEVHYAAIVDRGNRTTIGHGVGFPLPPTVVDKVNNGLTLEEAIGELTGHRTEDESMGTIGYLTQGYLDRERLMEGAVLAALLPRINTGLYSRGT